MNTMIFNFALFILWSTIAVTVLVISPFFAPDLLPDSVKNKPFLGWGTAMLALWNFVRWWSVRSRQKAKQEQERMELEYRLRTSPPDKTNGPKLVVHPEFRFDDEPSPPSAPPNGMAH